MDIAMLFDAQYSAEGLVCIDSIVSKQPDTRIFVLCLQVGTVEQALSHLQNGVALAVADLEATFPNIAHTKSERPWAPYTQSLKPYLMQYIFDTQEDVEKLCYVDSDMYFWGHPSEIETEFANYSFMVTTRSDRSNVAFNGGCFVCRNDASCRELLTWWQQKCYEWCLWEDGPQPGMFCEEGYLNIVRDEPLRFSNTYINQHPGINAAPWNIRGFELEQDGDGFKVNGRPLVCYQYRAYTKSQDFFDPTPLEERGFSENVINWLYHPYHNLIPIAHQVEG